VIATLERARDLGFLGPGPVEAHIQHAEGFALGVSEPPAVLLDLGAGGGVPGLVLAARWPDAHVLLVDAGGRRCAFLQEAVEALGMADRVRIIQLRAEEAGQDRGLRGTADLVTARSFGPPPVTAECAAPFLRVGGRLIVSEPPVASGERWPSAGLARLGLELRQAFAVPAHYQVLEQVRLCPAEYPRRTGVPAKRPLF
jgi:16S rRNA (guanine527-N7)-methyltransferase